MLEYESRPARYIPTAEDRQWLLRRWLYYLAHPLFVFLIAYTIGPNLVLFHRPWSPSPAHYATLTGPYVSMVAAIKAYQRDHGSLPVYTEYLPEGYRPADYHGNVGTIYGFPTVTFQVGEYSVLAYDFTPVTEGWIIYAPRYQGPIPVPIVPAAPSPATRPVTTRRSDANP